MVDPAMRTVAPWLGFVEALRRSAPTNARLITFEGTVHPQSWSGAARYDDGQPRSGFRAEPDPVLAALAPLAELVDECGCVVQLTVEPDGAVAVRLIEPTAQVELSMFGGVETVVLAPGCHPEPYRRVPADHQRPPSPAADPEKVTALVRQSLPSATPATAAELDAVEARLGRQLPADVRALYLAAREGDLVLASRRAATDAAADDDGVGRNADLEYEDDLFSGLRLIAPDGDRQWLEPTGRYLSWEYGATEVVAADHAHRVQALGASPAWFALGDDWGGNFYVVDLAPGPGGNYGQILFVDHETCSGANWLAGSLTELLTDRPVELEPKGDTDELSVWVGSHTRRTLTDVTTATEVLVVNRVDQPINLSPLAGHPRLRTLEIDPGQATGLAEVVGRLPALEYLRVDLATWQSLLDADQVPPTLLAAGIADHDATDWPANLKVTNALLASRSLPLVAVTELTWPGRNPEPKQAPAEAAPRAWWRRILGN